MIYTNAIEDDELKRLMNAYRVATYIARVASWLGAIVLIALTSSSVKEDWNDVVYVINAAFLLFGGIWLGNKAVERIAIFSEQKRDDVGGTE